MPEEISEEEYLRMEEALSETARGRAFLRMRDRQTRLVSQDAWSRLASRFERQAERMEGAPSGDATPSPSSALPSAPTLQEAHLAMLRREIQEMGSTILQARREIAALQPKEAGSNRIVAATGELDAIVTATERATTEILNATERIQEEAGRLRDLGEPALQGVDSIEAQCMEILQACGFQDLTGQRTTKVVNTLRYIEQRVITMINIWGPDGMEAPPAADIDGAHRKPNDDRPDAHLLNGPQLNGEGIDQAMIDAILTGGVPPPPGAALVPAASAAPDDPSPAPVPVVAPTTAPTRPAAASVGQAASPISQADIDALFA